MVEKTTGLKKSPTRWVMLGFELFWVKPGFLRLNLAGFGVSWVLSY